MSTDRREFLKQAGSVAVAATASAGISAAQSLAASEQLTVGVIGPGGMGSNHVQLLASRKDVRIAYLCDVDSNRVAAAIKSVSSINGTSPQGVKDLRTVLDDKTIDAVWIATPDHWHAPAAILAAEAGKHVYVEKPASHNIREGRLMIEAARRNKIVMQVGTQTRSSAHAIEAVQLLREGIIGDVLVAKAWNSQLRGSIGKQQPSQPPANLDFELWLGPAPNRPFQTNLLHSIWRWWYDFGAGDMGNDGVHDIDIARWGLGVDTHPTTAVALGGKYFFDDDQQFPDTQYVAFEYPANSPGGKLRQLIFEQRIWSPYVQEGYENGNAFYGTKGIMLFGKKDGFQVFGPRNKPIRENRSGGPNLPAHHQNFIDCIKDGKRPNADIEIGHLSSTLCHLGNIATRVGRVIHFDPAKEQITGDDAASKLVRRQYREGHWAVPKGV